MYKINFKYDLSKIDEAIEKLNIEEIYNVFYTPPFEVITTDYGYEYEEINSSEVIDVNLVVEEDGDLDRVKSILKTVLGLEEGDLKLESIDEDFSYSFNEIDLGNGWVLCDPSYETDLNRIDFSPQGAFGTGEHETTQDCLRWILEKDLTGKNIIDIGTGSGILSIASSIKGGKSVTALDIRDVKEEVQFNASLNSIDNIEVIVGDALEDPSLIEGEYDLTIINIGGEETEMFMDFISEITKKNGDLLVSGLFIRSFDSIVEKVKSCGFTLDKSIRGEEWCTASFKKN